MNREVTSTPEDVPDSGHQGIVDAFPAEAGPAKIHEIYNAHMFFTEARALRTMDQSVIFKSSLLICFTLSLFKIQCSNYSLQKPRTVVYILFNSSGVLSLPKPR